MPRATKTDGTAKTSRTAKAKEQDKQTEVKTEVAPSETQEQAQAPAAPVSETEKEERASLEVITSEKKLAEASKAQATAAGTPPAGPKIITGPEPVIPRQQMKVHGNRRGRPRDNIEWFADKDVPVVRREERHRTNDFSYAYFAKPCYLESNQAQQVFERNFQWADNALLIITLVSGIVGNEKIAKEQTKKADDLCSTFQGELREAIDQITQIMNERGLDKAEDQVPNYDHKRLYHPALHTPQSSRFVTVTELFDHVCARIDGAWIQNAISASERGKLIYYWTGRYYSYVSALTRLRAETMQIALNAGKRSEAGQIASRVEADQTNASIKSEDLGTEGLKGRGAAAASAAKPA